MAGRRQRRWIYFGSPVTRLETLLDGSKAAGESIDAATRKLFEERGVAMVFQSYALYPHKTVGENMGFALKMAGTARAEISRKTADVAASGRQQVEDTLKQLEAKQKNAKNPPIEVRLQQAGLSISKRQFFLFSGVAGLISFVLMYLSGMGLFLAIPAGIAGGFGIPRWAIGYMRKKRENKFIMELPNAIDVIVRGVKAASNSAGSKRQSGGWVPTKRILTSSSLSPSRS